MENWINTGSAITPQQNRRVIPTVTPTSNQFQPLATPDDNNKINFNPPPSPVPAFDPIDSYIAGIAPKRVASPTTPQPSATVRTTTTTTNQNINCDYNSTMSYYAAGLSSITNNFYKHCAPDIRRTIQNPNLTDVYDTRIKIGAVLENVTYTGSSTSLSWIDDSDDMLHKRLSLSPTATVPRPIPPKVVNIPTTVDEQRTHMAWYI